VRSCGVSGGAGRYSSRSRGFMVIACSHMPVCVFIDFAEKSATIFLVPQERSEVLHTCKTRTHSPLYFLAQDPSFEARSRRQPWPPVNAVGERAGVGTGACSACGAVGHRCHRPPFFFPYRLRFDCAKRIHASHFRAANVSPPDVTSYLHSLQFRPATVRPPRPRNWVSVAATRLHSGRFRARWRFL
jgi:hypothetical protein